MLGFRGVGIFSRDRRQGLTDDLPTPVGPPAISALAVGVAVLGALAMLIAVLLPFAQTTAAAPEIPCGNSLLQHACCGWPLILLAAGTAWFAVRAYRSQSRTWNVLILGVISVAASLHFGLDKGPLTSDQADGGSMIDSPGVAAYITGIGAALTAISGLLIGASPELLTAIGLPTGSRPTKVCPDCAETVLAAARVCKHCGHPFTTS